MAKNISVENCTVGTATAVITRNDTVAFSVFCNSAQHVDKETVLTCVLAQPFPARNTACRFAKNSMHACASRALRASQGPGSELHILARASARQTTAGPHRVAKHKRRSRRRLGVALIGISALHYATGLCIQRFALVKHDEGKRPCNCNHNLVWTFGLFIYASCNMWYTVALAYVPLSLGIALFRYLLAPSSLYP